MNMIEAVTGSEDSKPKLLWSGREFLPFQQMHPLADTDINGQLTGRNDGEWWKAPARLAESCSSGDPSWLPVDRNGRGRGARPRSGSRPGRPAARGGTVMSRSITTRALDTRAIIEGGTLTPSALA